MLLHLSRPAIVGARNSPLSINGAGNMGRPPINATPVNVRLPPQELAALDAWIARQSDAPSRPEAIRRLIEAGLRAEGEARDAGRGG